MRKNVSRLLLVLVSISIATGAAVATTISVPGNEPTIQAGLDAASAGDTVSVACGTYYEHSIAMKPGVYLTSGTGRSNCVTIDAQQQGRVFYCGATDSPTSIVGFTIAGGYTADGAGIFCSSSSLVVTACAFVENYAQGYGGGLYCQGCSPSLADCTFEWNTGVAGGGGVSCRSSSSPTLTNCMFSGNFSQSGGGMYFHSSSAAVSGCTFARNEAISGAGVYCSASSSPTLTSCTFEGNELHGGYGSGIYSGSLSRPTLEACIIAFGKSGEAIYCDDVQSTPELSCCDVYGNLGGDWEGCTASQSGVDGNLSEDPLFCDSPNGDFTLDAASSCAAGNSPMCGLIGARDVGCDSPVENVPWGVIKALYR